MKRIKLALEAFAALVFVEVTLWLFAATREELHEPVLPPPSPELVARAVRAHQQAALEQDLNQLDAFLAVALGNARMDSEHHRIIVQREERWLS